MAIPRPGVNGHTESQGQDYLYSRPQRYAPSSAPQEDYDHLGSDNIRHQRPVSTPAHNGYSNNSYEQFQGRSRIGGEPQPDYQPEQVNFRKKKLYEFVPLLVGISTICI